VRLCILKYLVYLTNQMYIIWVMLYMFRSRVPILRSSYTVVQLFVSLTILSLDLHVGVHRWWLWKEIRDLVYTNGDYTIMCEHAGLLTLVWSGEMSSRWFNVVACEPFVWQFALLRRGMLRFSLIPWRLCRILVWISCWWIVTYRWIVWLVSVVK
jgi:hypothetical protein